MTWEEDSKERRCSLATGWTSATARCLPHRSLLFKILADEAGLKSGVVGEDTWKMSRRAGTPTQERDVSRTGRHGSVDIMQNGGEPLFLEVTNPFVNFFGKKKGGHSCGRLAWYDGANNGGT